MAAALAVAALVAGFYYWWRSQTPPPIPPASEAQRLPAPAAPAGPKYPVPDIARDQPLPKLNESDATMRDALGAVTGSVALDRFFNLEDIVRRIVATIDNLPRERFAQRLSPLKPVPGLPKVKGSGDTLELDPANAARYEPLVGLMERLDTHSIAQTYLRYYPLFQDAYRELGYPEGHFNDRLVEVIDHLLATPEPHGPIKLVVSHVLYEFADPDLEELSSGQKVLVRIGPANAAKVKAKLRDLRAEIAGKAQ
jgi:hypothetical protein